MIPFNTLRSLVRRRSPRGGAERPGPASGRRGPILFLGDSITEQWGWLRPEFFAAHGFTCAGYGGETAGHMRMRLAPTMAETGAASLHLLCGINDIAHNATSTDDTGIRDCIAAILAEARALGAQTWIGSLTPAAWLVHGAIDPRLRIAAMNGWLRDHAERTGGTYVDYHAVLATPEGALRPDCSADGLHLTAVGYAMMEPVLTAALETEAGP